MEKDIRKGRENQRLNDEIGCNDKKMKAQIYRNFHKLKGLQFFFNLKYLDLMDRIFLFCLPRIGADLLAAYCLSAEVVFQDRVQTTVVYGKVSKPSLQVSPH